MPNFPLLQQAPLFDRYRLAQLLNERRLRGRAVEIGTHRGEFASKFLEMWNGGWLYCVDPWVSGYDAQDPASYGDREQDYAAAKAALRNEMRRVHILRMTSKQAARKITKPLDFVYVDGCHQRASVSEDLDIWWPKIRPGGIIAGHDIVCPGEVDGGWGKEVQPAVWAFASKVGARVVWIIVEAPQSYPWSYYIEKPQTA